MALAPGAHQLCRSDPFIESRQVTSYEPHLNSASMRLAAVPDLDPWISVVAFLGRPHRVVTARNEICSLHAAILLSETFFRHWWLQLDVRTASSGILTIGITSPLVWR